MTTRYYKNSIFIIILTSSLFFGNFLKNYKEKPALIISKQDSAINFDSDIAIFFSMGQRRLISDLLWVATLIESDLQHYKNNDLNSWMYLRFKDMTDYDPLFYQAYLFGGKYLNIVKDDLLGSHEIFKKSEKFYKEDYELNFNAGFLYAFELNWSDLAISRYSRILENPKAPPYIKSIILKLKRKQGIQLPDLYDLLVEMHNNEKDAYLKEKLLTEIYAIKAEIDLSCLNNNQLNCNTRDLDNNFYILNSNGVYSAPKKFKKFKIYEKKR
jgi:hypothetical protein